MYKSALAHFPYGQSANFHCHPRARLCGLQTAPQTLAEPNSHIKTPGKIFIGNPLNYLPYGQRGTGRLSFHLRKLQRNAKPPDFLCSLRSILKKRCRDSARSPEKLSGTTPSLRCAPGWLRSDPTIFPTNHQDSTLLCPRPHRGEYRLRQLQCDS